METDSPKLQIALVFFFTSLVIVGAIDLILDRPSTWMSMHVLVEVAFVLLSAAFAVVLLRGWKRTTEQLRDTQQALSARSRERDEWQRSAQQALEGLGRAIDQQFRAWELTAAEREVALLLLQGFGHKEIAVRTNRSERTVRQHAVVVYQKSGLAGRAELAAFFLQGLMLPANGASDDAQTRGQATR